MKGWRGIVWLLESGVPFLLRIAGIALLAWGYGWDPMGVWFILGAIVLWDLASGWRNAARGRFLSNANCIICGQRMEFAENAITHTDTDGSETRVDWHFTHRGDSVIDTAMQRVGLSNGRS